MDGAIRSRKKRDRRDVLPDDAGAVAVLINEILRDLAGINHFAVLQRDDILRVGIAGDPVRAGEGSALTGEEVLLGKAHKPHVAGEQALLELNADNICIIRTGWLFGPGKRNFVDDILNACHRRDSITIVDDRTGSPTYSLDLALWSIMLAERQATGLWHAVNSGQATWCELACEAVGLAGNECRVEPIPSSQWPQKAPRPPYTVLGCGKLSEYLGMHPRPWTQALREHFFCDPFDA